MVFALSLSICSMNMLSCIAQLVRKSGLSAEKKRKWTVQGIKVFSKQYIDYLSNTLSICYPNSLVVSKPHDAFSSLHVLGTPTLHAEYQVLREHVNFSGIPLLTNL